MSEFDVIHRLIGDTSTFDQNTHFPILREGFAPKNDAEKKLETFLWDILKNEDIKKQLNDKGQIKFQTSNAFVHKRYVELGGRL